MEDEKNTTSVEVEPTENTAQTEPEDSTSRSEADSLLTKHNRLAKTRRLKQKLIRLFPVYLNMESSRYLRQRQTVFLCKLGTTGI